MTARFDASQKCSRRKEYERRYLVRRIDPDVFRCSRVQITQGYLDSACRHNGLRIRIIDGRTAVLTRKDGHGVARLEKNQPTDVPSARFLLESTDEIVNKTRHFRGGWEIDRFHDELNGLILAEFETEAPDQPVSLPPWISEAVEVTDYLSNRDLARLVKFLKGQPPVPNLSELLLHRLPRIVLTGGPCSGKSTMMRAFEREFDRLVHTVPETATIVIGQVGCRPPIGDPVAMGLFQETIFRTQRAFEMMAEIQAWRDGKRAILLDRGTGDNAAYLTNGWTDLERVGKTSKEFEFRQYDLVLCLEAPPEDVFEREKANNPARGEKHYSQVVNLSRAIEAVWGDHPGFVFIPNSTDWEEKIGLARWVIQNFLNGHVR
jgi:CYTH domain-containing protein/predicted ATPase